jgi:hypothetical protein
MNRTHALLAGLALALALPAAAQTAQDPQHMQALPPPGLNDPGVKAGEPDRSGQKPIERPVPYDQAQDTRSTPATSDAEGRKVSAADLPSLDGGGARDGRGDAPPDVTVRQQGDDRVEEYRTGGKLFMVRIVPKNGVPQTYMADPNGRLIRDARNGPVDPVYYKVYEWGAAPKPTGE